MTADGARPPVAEITSTFETLTPPEAATAGEPICRGTHQYERATVERTYHRTTDGMLAAETGYLRDGETVDTVDECWLLADGRLAHTDQAIHEFCRGHHAAEPAADLAFCLDAERTATDRPEVGEVTSTFQPATDVRLEDGAPLRFTGTHETAEASVERAFFVDETTEVVRVRTVFFWQGTRLGSLTEQQDLIDDGTFVATTGEPVDAFCRRSHLLDPEADLRYCARLGRGETPSDPPERER